MKSTSSSNLQYVEIIQKNMFNILQTCIQNDESKIILQNS